MSAAANGLIHAGAVRTMRPLALKLDQDAVYMTPTGRLCKVYGIDNRGGEYPVAQLRYVRGSEERAADWADGFCLMPENWRILTRVC